MKKSWLLSVAIGLASVAAAPLAHAQTGRINNRDARQQQRIQAGVARGDLTPMEYRRLEMGQRRIDVMQRQASRDGVVTRWEQARIEQAQNDQNRMIQRLRNNGRRGNGRFWQY